MLNLDSGRYFLSVLLPILDGEFDSSDGTRQSHVQAIRDMLSVGATARQSPVTHWVKNEKREMVHNTRNSHFARNLKTHFTRIFVIENVVYNGRTGVDTLVNLVKGLFGKGANLLVAQKVDTLSTPYLAYFAEIDAPKGEEAELDEYLEELWGQISEKLAELFEHCYGFEKVKDAKSFCTFMRAGQVETLMPFNDYWQSPPALKEFWKTPYIVPALGVALLGAVLSLALSWWWLPVTLAALVFTLWATIMIYGGKPFPMAPDSDLRSVLKALYLQNNLIDFHIDNQGRDADSLHASFGRFLEKNKPSNLEGPTQKPGTIHAEGE